MQQQKHLVFGAGLIGGFIAGGLLEAKFHCSIVAREAVRTALSDGFKLTDYLGNEASTSAPHFASARHSEAYDYIWLTVKCTAVEAALEELASYIGDSSTIICCQNGFGSVQLVRARFPNTRIVRAVFGSNVAQPSRSHLHRSTEGTLVIENDGQDDIPALAAQLNSALIPVRSSDDYRAEQWAKLQLNLANAVNALADIPVKQMLEQRPLRKLIAELMREMLIVTDAMDIRLPRLSPLPPHWIPRLLDVPDWLFGLLGQKMLAIDPTARTSMWWDLHNGKATEIDYLNSAVVREASRLSLAAPVNQRLVDLVKAVESGQRERGWSPDELAANLLREPHP